MFWKKKRKQQGNIDIFVELIVEEYRFLKSYTSLMSKLLKDELPKYTSIYNYHIDKLDEIMNKHNIKIVDLVGKPYDDGLSINPLNIEDFNKDDKLVIEQILEPLIVSTIDGKIIKSGTVILSKIEKSDETKEGEKECL